MFCQNSTEHFFGAERSVLTEHLDPMFPLTLRQTQIDSGIQIQYYGKYLLHK